MRPIGMLRIIFQMTAYLLLTLSHDTAYGETGRVDVHVHLDPMGWGRKDAPPSFPGTRNQPEPSRSLGTADYESMAKNIVSLMDRMGVEKAVLMPPPKASLRPGRVDTYAACLSAAKYYPTRFLIGGGGHVLNPLIHGYGKNKITSEVRKKFRDEAEKLIKEGIVVFGEMAALHLSLHEGHGFSQCDPDHPLFLLLADIAAESDIPIDLHMEAVPIDMPTPEDILEISSSNPDTLNANISGFERLLEHNRKAKIVWQHVGWDNIGAMTTRLLADLLKKHPNLYLALRVEHRRMKAGMSGPMPNRIVDGDGNVTPQWTKLITEFSDRIVIGSDEFMGLTRQQPRGHDSFCESWDIVSQFPEEIARKIGSDNARRIYNVR